MTNQNIDAIAIRFDTLKGQHGNLTGTTPIAVFADQGMQFASLPSLPGVRKVAGSPLKHAVDKVIMVLDISSSMSEAVSPVDHTDKLEHVVARLKAFLEKNDFDQSKLSLVVFNGSASKENFQNTKELLDRLSKLAPGGNTSFSAAFDDVIKEIGSDKTSRKLIIFDTDGQDGTSSHAAKKLAVDIKNHNAGVVIAGVGANYDLSNLLFLSGVFGYSAWGHTPMPDPKMNIFEALLPEFLNNMQSSDHYLDLEAKAEKGKITDAWGFTPSIRPFRPDDNMAFGYTQSAIGVYFMNKSSEPELTLHAGDFINDPDGSERKIDIIDADQAAAHFERMGMGEDAIAQVLLLRAKLALDKDALESLAKKNSAFAPDIQAFLDNMQGDPNDEMTRMGFNASVSMTGNTFTLSQIDPNSFAGHSGGLGPLDDSSSVGTVAPLVAPDARKYDQVVPAGHANLSFTDPDSGQKVTFDLDVLSPGQLISVGRSPDNDITISQTQLSRWHFSIKRLATGEYQIVDSGSRNGTYVNKIKLTGAQILTSGDTIEAGPVRIKFR